MVRARNYYQWFSSTDSISFEKNCEFQKDRVLPTLGPFSEKLFRIDTVNVEKSEHFWELIFWESEHEIIMIYFKEHEHYENL